MTPPASAFKKAPKKEEPPLFAVVILDVYDQRFAPIQESYPCFGMYKVANVPVINYVMSWLLKTEVKSVKLVVNGQNAEYAVEVERYWKSNFDELQVIACDGAMNIGDCMRELHNRELINGDFILIENPTAVVSSSLTPQIADFRKRRRESADNVMTLLYSHRENQEKSLIGVNPSTNKLMLFPAANSLTQVKVDKKDFYEGVDIRRDVTSTGIAFCSRLIATQFSDNFDFVCLDDVVREILSKDDILGMNVHVDVLPSRERAFSAHDYESLVLLNTLILERWFYPLVPETSDVSRYFTSNPRNIYLQEDGENISIKAKTNILNDYCSTVSLGVKTTIAYDALITTSSIGGYTCVGEGTTIRGSLIGENCKIGSNCIIESSFIGDRVIIPDGTHIPKETVIGNDVIYPKEQPVIHNSAVFKSAINEEKYDRMASNKIGSVYVVKMRHDAPLWRRAVNGKTNFAVEDSDSDLSGDEDGNEDDEFGDGIDNATRQFHDEVLESMQKILESKEQLMRNLILEINSSKLACNVTMDDVARNVFAAFLQLEGNDQLKTLFDLVKKWRPLFLNYYKSSEESLAAKSPAQRKVELELKRKCQIQMLLAVEDKYEKEPERFGPKVAKIVHFLYNDADVLDEEAILEWAKTIAEESPLKKIMQPIVDWLQEEDEEEEEESDEE